MFLILWNNEKNLVPVISSFETLTLRKELKPMLMLSQQEGLLMHWRGSKDYFMDVLGLTDDHALYAWAHANDTALAFDNDDILLEKVVLALTVDYDSGELMTIDIQSINQAISWKRVSHDYCF